MDGHVGSVPQMSLYFEDNNTQRPYEHRIPWLKKQTRTMLIVKHYTLKVKLCCVILYSELYQLWAYVAVCRCTAFRRAIDLQVYTLTLGIALNLLRYLLMKKKLFSLVYNIQCVSFTIPYRSFIYAIFMLTKPRGNFFHYKLNRQYHRDNVDLS